ncbi:NAD(P)-binding protein [Gonapodya prolifera JEL478]|uniref:NAD(P)-binding protein n=1 Tax=Gonapodya prolifera (strain JEL478) TaxID=1344416 RepID=A0A139AD21_GONPJ|nr:NAD(P)-binding protein [Gonapodya prolifera JEL478]|eukprot:KXS14484.1 NAD(P)-binding protein [Gonapodya prolifera JEL478]
MTRKLSTIDNSIAGKVAVVTGAGSGLGRATAHLLSDYDVKVAALDTNLDSIRTVVGEITAVYGEGAAHGWKCDVRSMVEIQEIVQQCLGFEANQWTSPNSEKRIQFLMDVNVTGTARMISASTPHLAKAATEVDRPRLTKTPWVNPSRIINVDSAGPSGSTAYDISKRAVMGITRSACIRLGPMGIAVNAVCPGPILTPLTKAYTSPFINEIAKIKPNRRAELLEDEAQGIVIMCMPGMSAMHGHFTMVDGGVNLKKYGHTYDFDALEATGVKGK